MRDQELHINRRRFMRAASLACAGLGVFAAQPSLASVSQVNRPRGLAFAHTHTGETLKVEYANRGGYLSSSLSEINQHLRDFRTGEVYPISTNVLDQLFEAREALAPNGVFEVISGYRSPKTNAALRSKNRGVAKRSLHMQGRAIDVRLRGVRTADLRRFLASLGRGGVGYYRRSDFVHLDDGRPRSW